MNDKSKNEDTNQRMGTGIGGGWNGRGSELMMTTVAATGKTTKSTLLLVAFSRRGQPK